MNMEHVQQLDATIPSWQPECLVERSCPFCGDDGHEHCVRPDGLAVRSCDTCGAFFVSPAPNESELRTLYATYSTQHSRKGKPNARAILRARPRDDFRLVEIASHVRLRGKRVLDVGCGWGTLLKRFEKLGADVVGTDLDPAAVRFAREQLGLSAVTVGTLEDVARDELFDVVCMFDFLEHPLDPLRQLEQAVALLAPQGIIAIWTPNASSAPDEQEPVLFKVDLEHMQYVSMQTCQWLARELDLRILHAESVGSPHLNGINASHGRNGKRSILTSLVETARGLPGWHVLRAIGNGIHSGRIPDPRRGTYHLFCILQKDG
jgi:2-polyprenyl-3-methyl-5-hydroxy-6-metoxy-1,4-benzoquinol methylase